MRRNHMIVDGLVLKSPASIFDTSFCFAFGSEEIFMDGWLDLSSQSITLILLEYDFSRFMLAVNAEHPVVFCPIQTMFFLKRH